MRGQKLTIYKTFILLFAALTLLQCNIMGPMPEYFSNTYHYYKYYTTKIGADSIIQISKNIGCIEMHDATYLKYDLTIEKEGIPTIQLLVFPNSEYEQLKLCYMEGQKANSQSVYDSIKATYLLFFEKEILVQFK